MDDLAHLDNWGARPGTVTSGPAGYAVGDQQHVFYRRADGQLEHRYYDRSAAAVAVENWGGELAGTPVAYVHGDEQHVFARGSDGSLRHWRYAPGLPTVPARDTWAGPGTVTSDVSGYAYADQQHVFYRTASGTLEHRYWDQSAGRLTSENWGGELVGTPIAYVHGYEQHVFARGSDGSLRHWWYAPGMATVPARDTWAGPGSVTSDPAGYAVGDQEHVFYRGASGTLEHRYWDHSAGRLGSENWGGLIPPP